MSSYQDMGLYWYKFHICIRRLERLPLQYNIFRVAITREEQTALTDSFPALNGEAEPNELLEMNCAFYTLPNDAMQVMYAF